MDKPKQISNERLDAIINAVESKGWLQLNKITANDIHAAFIELRGLRGIANSKGIELIAVERQRQSEKEGWTASHDKQHVHGELAMAAACYAMPKRHRAIYQNTYRGVTRLLPMKWPFESEEWKPTPNDRIRELTKAGALIAAEIDRIIIAEEE